MNNRTKMYRTNKKAIAYMKKLGFITYTVPHSRFSLDAFGIADLIAIRKGVVWFIQCQTNQFHSLKKYDSFYRKHNVNIMVLMFKDREKEPYHKIWASDKAMDEYFYANPIIHKIDRMNI